MAKKDMRTYSFLNEKKETMEINLPLEMENQKLQSEKDYETSFSYIQKQEFYIWR